MKLQNIKQPFIEKFPGDFSGNLMQRQTPKVLFCTVSPAGFENPELIIYNKKLSEEIGLGTWEENDLPFLVGNNLPENIQTYATAYAGHQFGNWAGQLGDGRAIFAGEIGNPNQQKTEIQWKGAGATPYSRHADGRAVLRSSVREYLMSEAMFHLKIPTTRALSLAFTGEKVIRDIMYNGNPQEENGAVVIRTAESFLRFGHFELLSAQKEFDTLKKLADFTIDNYFPEIGSVGKQKYQDFFEKVCKKTADLMVDWLRVGFVHGVMNTDNMSVLGLTIDYGPFAMLEEFDLNFTSNTTDLPGRRYAFGKQPQIAQWNLWQLANSLFPIIEDEKFLEQILDDFSSYFWEEYDKMMLKKFGLGEFLPEDQQFFADWQNMMTDLQLDYTLFFSCLEKWRANHKTNEFLSTISYVEVNSSIIDQFETFLDNYQNRLSKNTISDSESLGLMKKNNPKFILRNYLLFECIQELEVGQKDLFEKLLTSLENPYEEIHPEFSKKRPEKYNDLPGCSMLSCSS